MKRLAIILSIFTLIGAGCFSSTDSDTASGTTTTTTPSVPSTATSINQAVGGQPGQTAGDGPYTHEIRTASSVDGLIWTSDSDEPIVEHASVPTVITTASGAVNVYFVDASQGKDRLGCLQSTDGGVTFAAKSCVINDAQNDWNVDFSIVLLADGRYRLYYYSVDGKIDEVSQHHINSAISTDGFTFTEEGAVFTYSGLVDPDVFWNGSQWVMQVMSLSAPGTVVATSTDGTNFSYLKMFSPEKVGTSKPIQLSDGSFRLYTFVQGEQTKFYSYTSTDGLNWTAESGVRFTGPAGYQITDPSVTRLANGSYKMVYKLSPDLKSDIRR